MRYVYARIGLIFYPILLPFMRPFLRGSHRVYVAITFEGRVLLVKNWLARDTWRLAGGGIKKNESKELAAIREIKQELGIDIIASRLHIVTSGVLHTDSLNAKYVVFHYELQRHEEVTANKFEIVDWNYFESIPDSMHPDFMRSVSEVLKY